VGSCAFLDPILPCDIDQTLLWDYQSGEIVEILNIGAPFISFSPDGNYLAFGRKENNSVVLWDIKNHRSDKEWITEYVVGENTFMFLTNENLLAGNQIWNIQTGQPVSTPLPVSYKTAFSPDGNTLFSVYNGNISQSDIKTGDERIFAQIADQYDLEILAVHPDGNMLAIWGKDRKSVILVNKYQPFQPYQPLGRFLAESELPEFADLDFGTIVYSPDKSIKASIDFINDMIVLSDTQSGSEIRTLDTEGAHLWENIIFSPDGETLASIEYLDIILWDVESGQPIGKPLPKTGSGIEFTPNGNSLVTIDRGRYILWDINPRSWIEQTCRRVGRNFTILEWERYFPGEKYRATCPQWPLSH
jgi:WD40 repeat protein